MLWILTVDTIYFNQRNINFGPLVCTTLHAVPRLCIILIQIAIFTKYFCTSRLQMQFWLVGFFAIAYNVDFGSLQCLPSLAMSILVHHHIACKSCKCPLPNSSIFQASFYVEETSVKIAINFRLEHLTRRTRYFGARTSRRWCPTTKRENAISSTARRSVRPFRMKSRRSCR
jgi:hypothetical protein